MTSRSELTIMAADGHLRFDQARQAPLLPLDDFGAGPVRTYRGA